MAARGVAPLSRVGPAGLSGELDLGGGVPRHPDVPGRRDDLRRSAAPGNARQDTHANAPRRKKRRPEERFGRTAGRHLRSAADERSPDQESRLKRRHGDFPAVEDDREGKEPAQRLRAPNDAKLEATGPREKADRPRS